jgi:hypothetical protein
MRSTHASAAAATLGVVAWASVAFVFVALMGLVRSVLDVLPAAAVVPARPELGVEGVQDLDTEPGQRLGPDQRLDVVLVFRLVAADGLGIHAEDLEVLSDQLVHRRSSLWVASLVDLVEQPYPCLFGQPRLLRTWRYHFGEVEPPLDTGSVPA